MDISETEDGCRKYTAITKGSASDNPTSAIDLNQFQKDHSVAALFENVSSFTITFGATSGVGGRNFMFSSIASLCGKFA